MRGSDMPSLSCLTLIRSAPLPDPRKGRGGSKLDHARSLCWIVVARLRIALRGCIVILCGTVIWWGIDYMQHQVM
jgi:hypothetical protein